MPTPTSKPTVAAKQPIAVTLEAGKEYFFCACGRSAHQPFCDGSHKGSTFGPQPFIAEKDGDAHLCQCKQSANLPFCDGSHSAVPDSAIGKEYTPE